MNDIVIESTAERPYLGFVAVHIDVPLQVELCCEALATGVTIVYRLKREDIYVAQMAKMMEI